MSEVQNKSIEDIISLVKQKKRWADTKLIIKAYNYAKENFLSSISRTINPPSNMLLEHYRCDYNIINYCNKFFYDNQLKIYKDAKKDSMSLVDEDKGKYVEKEENGSYYNRREIKCIDEFIEHDIKEKFIIRVVELIF